MATIRAYTDISQSKVLAEILPLESADMCINSTNPYALFTEVKPLEGFDDVHDPCWSLAALLKILSFPSLTQNKEDEWEVCVFDHDNDDYIKKTASNPVDTCYEIILYLKDKNLL